MDEERVAIQSHIASDLAIEPTGYDIGFLDRLGMLFVCLDSNQQSTFISSAAARFFELDSIEKDSGKVGLISPLLQLVSKSKLNPVGFDSKKLNYLTLRTALGQNRDVVAVVRLLHKREEVELEETYIDFESAVLFYDFSSLDTVSMIMKQSRICRDLYFNLVIKNMDAEQQLARLLEVAKRQATYLQQYQQAEVSTDKIDGTDLLEAINKAMQILDYCILKSVRFGIKVNNPCVLVIRESDFLRIMISIVNKACEFVGVYGEMQLDTEFIGDKSVECKVALILRAKRSCPLADPLDPVSFFVHHYCLPNYFGGQEGQVVSSPIESSANFMSYEESDLTDEMCSHFYEELINTCNLLSANGGSLTIEPVNNRSGALFRIELPLAQIKRQ